MAEARVEVSLSEDFLQALAQSAGLDLHVELPYDSSPHHVVEAIFKGVAHALRTAVEIDPHEPSLPTVKGALSQRRFAPERGPDETVDPLAQQWGLRRRVGAFR